MHLARALSRGDDRGVATRPVGPDTGEQCPLRPGEECHLCVAGSRGPHECPTVWLVMHDPELRDQLVEICREAASGNAEAVERPAD